jgi:glucose-1-phosphate thymidylyltransferase
LKAIILAAGYARRLYPLTENWPKPLLLVSGKPMIERVLDSLAPIEALESVHIVTNAKFYGEFCNWLNTYRLNNGHFQISMINNLSGNPHEMGALGNLHLVLEQQNIDDDIIVVAADNLFSRTLEEFAIFARTKNAPVVAIYEIDDLNEARRFGSVKLDETGKINFFQEKPAEPTSLTIAVALYYYPRSCLPLIRKYVLEQDNGEEPGRLVEWMYKRIPFYTWPLPGIWCDIGSEEKLKDANRVFAKVDKTAG